MRGLSPVVASGGHSSSRCAGLSLSRSLFLRSTGSRRAGSVIVAHGPSCSAARGIFPDQGLNPCALHWQADSQPLRHQGSPQSDSFKTLLYPSSVHNPQLSSPWYRVKDNVLLDLTGLKTPSCLPLWPHLQLLFPLITPLQSHQSLLLPRTWARQAPALAPTL